MTIKKITLKEPPVEPLFPLKHRFSKSLDRYLHEAGMLADAVRVVLLHSQIEKKGADILAERLHAFEIARFGKDHK